MAVDINQSPPPLLPCPFCGKALDVVWRKINPRAKCHTEGCFGSSMRVVNLDDPGDVQAWNSRAGHARVLVNVFHIVDGMPDRMWMTDAERNSYRHTGVLP